LNQIPYPWTLLGSDIPHPGLDSSLLELKVLIPFWTRTSSQFRLVSSIFLSSPEQLTRVAFILLAYPTGLLESCLNSLSNLHPSVLPDRINAYPVESPYLILTRSYPIELPYLIGLLPIRLYPATVLDFLARPGNASLYPTAYPVLPNHLAWSSTLQLVSPENFLIVLPP
jgi:hypothetical protein